MRPQRRTAISFTSDRVWSAYRQRRERLTEQVPVTFYETISTWRNSTPHALPAKRFAKHLIRVNRACSKPVTIRRYSNRKPLPICCRSLLSPSMRATLKKVAARFQRLAARQSWAKRSSTNASTSTAIRGIRICRVRVRHRVDCRRGRSIWCATACWKSRVLAVLGQAERQGADAWSSQQHPRKLATAGSHRRHGQVDGSRLVARALLVHSR